MAKIHPQSKLLSSSFSSGFLTSKQETFTIWMKSLVLNGKGCTVFDSEGQILYRVDNYNCKCRDVYLMDSKGEVLCTIVKKKRLKIFRFWEGYGSASTKENKKKVGLFQVRKQFKISRGCSSCEVIVGGLEENDSFHYSIESCTTRNSACKCKIIDKLGRGPIAEVKRKVSKRGELFGEDVLTMVVEPFVDHCLIMGLFVVYSLINSKM
ncbi:hypothetical protein UlMin_015814 [Ulmus minor]